MLLREEEEIGYRREFRHFATQFASAISQMEVDNGQWVGRLFRVYGKFRAPGDVQFGMDDPPPLPQDEEERKKALADREKVDIDAAEQVRRFQEFLTKEKISELEIGEVTYEIDPSDPEGLHYFAKGFIDIKKSEGEVFKAGKRYRFTHRIKKTYHTRETIIEEVGEIPGQVAPSNEETEAPTE